MAYGKRKRVTVNFVLPDCGVPQDASQSALYNPQFKVTM